MSSAGASVTGVLAEASHFVVSLLKLLPASQSILGPANFAAAWMRSALAAIVDVVASRVPENVDETFEELTASTLQGAARTTYLVSPVAVLRVFCHHPLLCTAFVGSVFLECVDISGRRDAKMIRRARSYGAPTLVHLGVAAVFAVGAGSLYSSGPMGLRVLIAMLKLYVYAAPVYIVVVACAILFEVLFGRPGRRAGLFARACRLALGAAALAVLYRTNFIQGIVSSATEAAVAQNTPLEAGKAAAAVALAEAASFFGRGSLTRDVATRIFGSTVVWGWSWLQWPFSWHIVEWLGAPARLALRLTGLEGTDGVALSCALVVTARFVGGTFLRSVVLRSGPERMEVDKVLNFFSQPRSVRLPRAPRAPKLPPEYHQVDEEASRTVAKRVVARPLMNTIGSGTACTNVNLQSTFWIAIDEFAATLLEAAVVAEYGPVGGGIAFFVHRAVRRLTLAAWSNVMAAT